MAGKTAKLVFKDAGEGALIGVCTERDFLFHSIRVVTLQPATVTGSYRAVVLDAIDAMCGGPSRSGEQGDVFAYERLALELHTNLRVYLMERLPPEVRLFSLRYTRTFGSDRDRRHWAEFRVQYHQYQLVMG